MVVKASFLIICLFVGHLLCMLPVQTEAKAGRVRRQACQDGTYEHNGRECCKCSAGSKVEMHCTDKPETVKCTPCEEGKEYQAHANAETTCERCTSCAHPNANLVVDRECTRYVDSTCKCKEDHFCEGGGKPCLICDPCPKCGPEGEKVPCSATNKTVCNDDPKAHALAIALGVLCPLVVVAIGVGYFVWKKRSRNYSVPPGNGPVDSSPVQILQPDTELPESLRPHIPDIAPVIGWKLARNLAMKSKIPKGRLESCEDRFPKDDEESTIALLNIWVEKEGRNATPLLIQYLKDRNKNGTVEEVLKILRSESS